MPNIQTSKLNYLSMPQEHNGYIFKSIAKSRQGNEDFILTQYKDQEFLLRVIYRKKNILIKGDKLTKVSPISIIKNALKNFQTLHELELSFSNIGGSKYDEHFKNSNKYLKDMAYFINDFKTNREIWVEVGFGSGRHLLHQAKENPEIQFIAIEIHRPSIEQVIAQCKIQNLENILIINFDARIFLELLESNSVGKIFVHFPVPWDKKPHRRVINEDFIKEAKRALKKKGFLHLRTDSENYFNYSLNLFIKQPKTHIEVKKNIPYEITSKYEERWIKLGKNIYDIYFYSLEDSPQLNEKFDFTFDKKLINLDFTPKVYNNFVVHLEKEFKIDEKQSLIRATIGNFNRPEHIYILNKDKPEYFKLPAPVKDNYLAHLELKRLFS